MSTTILCMSAKFSLIMIELSTTSNLFAASNLLTKFAKKYGKISENRRIIVCGDCLLFVSSRYCACLSLASSSFQTERWWFFIVFSMAGKKLEKKLDNGF